MDAKKKSSVKNKGKKSTLKKTSVKKKVLKKPVTKKKVISKKPLKKAKKTTLKQVSKKSLKKSKTLKKVSKTKTKSISKKASKPILKNIHDPSEVKGFYEKHYSHTFNKKKTFYTIFCKSLWFSICIVFFTIFFDFILRLILHSSFPAIVVYYSKHSLFYGFFILFMALLSFGAYISFAYESIKRRFSFRNFSKSIFKLTVIFFILEFILLVISYFTIYVPYLTLFGLNGSYAYLVYLIMWSLIKFILLLCISIVSYILFSNVNSMKR